MKQIRKLISPLQEFMAVPFQKYLVFALVLLGVVALFMNQLPSDKIGSEDLLFFYHPSCPHCADQKPFLDELEVKYDVIFTRLDVSSSANKVIFEDYVAKYNLSAGVPLTIIGETYVVGFDTAQTTGVVLESLLVSYISDEEPLHVDSADQLNSTTDVGFVLEKSGSWLGDLRNYSLPTLAIILGLLDGFNPCAMWVLIVLISLVAQLQDKRRIWFIVGSFLLASGVLYFLFMTAWLNVFLFIGAVRPLMILVGIVAIGSGILSLRAFFTKADMNCTVGDADEKRKTVSKMRAIVSAPMSIMTIFSVIVLAFVVNSIEFACSSAIPAVFTQMLVLSEVTGLTYYWYILVYVFFFMLDDLIIFSIAIFALSHVSQEKYLRYSTLIGGVLLLILGLLLAFFPTVLAGLL
jgi:glutaredoxin